MTSTRLIATVVVPVLCAGFALGYASKGSPPAEVPPPSSSVTAAHTKAEPAALKPDASATAPDMAPMFGKMSLEAKNRPGIAPTSDDAFAAFARAGVPFVEPKQSMGSTYKAAYCSHGLSASKNVSVLVCEFTDPDAAGAGLAISKQVFPALPRRKSWVHKSLMMATMPQDAASPPAALAEIDKIVAAFNAL